MTAAESGPITVLVAEDHELVRESLSRMLMDLGYSVLSVASGEEALATCRDESVQVDVLLVDVVMPDMGGPEVAAKATEAAPGLKYIFMSGYPGNVLEEHGVGATETYLVKPFRGAEIQAAIAQVLAS
jgi:CheY-like chemotaxis protein